MYEYLVESLIDDETLEARLNDCGRQNWKVVTMIYRQKGNEFVVSNFRVVFYREVI